MTPIETEFAGYRFRSRLEARWAVFFDCLPGVTWEFEPEGFELPGGGRYLPDFRVRYPGLDGHLWFEVKPRVDLITSAEWAKLRAFPESDLLYLLDGTPSMRLYGTVYDRPRHGGAILWSHKRRPWWDDLQLIFSDPEYFDLSTLQTAVNAALSARFEHGETRASNRTRSHRSAGIPHHHGRRRAGHVPDV